MSAAANSKMRPVAIVGVGSTPFGKLADRDIVGIAVDACRDAIEDSGIVRKRIHSPCTWATSWASALPVRERLRPWWPVALE